MRAGKGLASPGDGGQSRMRPHPRTPPLAAVALVGVALCVAVALSACGGSSSQAASGDGGWRAADPLPAGLAGKPAPAFRLADARGGTLSSSSLEGAPYAVTFLYTACPDVCPIIGEEIRRALSELGPDARRLRVVAISVDPRGDTPDAVRLWLRRHREPSNFHYLVGSRAELQPVWKAYFAAPQIPGDPESSHTAAIWLVDRRGRLAAKVSAGTPVAAPDLASDLHRLLEQR